MHPKAKHTLRSAVLSTITLIVLGGGFAAYWHFQPAEPKSVVTEPTIATTREGPAEFTQMNIGPGKHGWSNSYDDKGRLSSQFTAAEFTPQKDNTFNVVRPVNLFYLDDGQYIAVTGKTGVVFVNPAQGGSVNDSGMPAGMQAPNRGLLRDVHIGIYPNKNSLHETLSMDVNNLWFDNDTLRVYTQEYTETDGAKVLADQVKVTIRGDDYDFDGRGLTMRWNGRDRHLHLLEIAHGEKLTIKHPSKMNSPFGGPTTVKTSLGPAESVPLIYASTSAPAPSAPAAARIAYRAVFNDSVKVFQGNLQVALADVMTADFLPGAEKKSSTTKPAAAQAPAEPASPSGEVAAPAAAQKMADTTMSPAKEPASQPTTRGADAPVTITWTGKLRITPMDSEPALPITAGQAAIRLVGSPVKLTPEGSEVTAADVRYRAGDGEVALKNSEAIPLIEVKQNRGMTFTTESMNYDPATEIATIIGDSHLQLPLEGQQQPLKASWNKTGTIHFTGKAAQPDSADRIDLTGEVAIDHPQMKLRSDELALGLVKRAANAGEKSAVSLKLATATGSVNCRLNKPGQPDQGIDADKLVLEMEDGAVKGTIPKTVTADGNVHAFDADQSIRSGHLEALLRPSLKPENPQQKKATTHPSDDQAVVLDSVFASSKVQVNLKGGEVALADELNMKTVNDSTQIELRGKPFASVVDQSRGTLQGPVIEVSKALKQPASVKVVGAGGIDATFKSSPVKVTWANWMRLNGPGNAIDADGDVNLAKTDADGSVRTGHGDHAHIDLMEDTGAKTKKPTTRRAEGSDAMGSGFENKALKAVTLAGNFHGESVLKASDGSVVQQAFLKGPKLVYDVASGQAEIPGAGALFVEDHGKSGATGEGRGTMATGWTDFMIYDSLKKRITIDGSSDKVHTVFQQDRKNAARMNLDCKMILIDLKDAPTTQPAGDTGQISHLRAANSVDFTTNQIRFKAHTLDYDPETGLMTATGSDQEPGEVFDNQNNLTGGFGELVYDAKAELIKSVHESKGAVRK